MVDECFLPDNQMLAAVARSYAVEAKLAAAAGNGSSGGIPTAVTATTTATAAAANATAALPPPPSSSSSGQRFLSASDIWNTQDWTKG